MSNALTIPMPSSVGSAADSLDQYMRTIKSFPVLSAEEEIGYATRLKNNGDIAMSIVEQKANKFGEALVRVSHPTQQQLKAYEPVVLNPTKIRVVLDLNSIDFDINTVQLYGFDIGFIAIHPGDA